MRAIPSSLPGALVIEPDVHGDARGFFCETYRRDAFAELGIVEEMVQDNHSRSRRGVVRGMHLQTGDGTSKLVRCAAGEILDVIVDVRRGSPTYGRWEAFQLSGENMRILYCPVGFAHGFCVLSDFADVIYKQSSYYSPERERGFKYDDPAVGIAWPDLDLVPSQRDLEAPPLSVLAGELRFTY